VAAVPEYVTPGVYVEELADPPSVGRLPTDVVGFVGTAAQGLLDEPVEVTSWAEFETMFGGPVAGCGLPYAVRDFFANGGRRAVVVRVEGSGVPTVEALVGAAGSGMRALDRVPDLNLLAIPPEEGGDLPPDAAAAAYDWCLGRRAVLLLDGPAGWTSAAGAATAARSDLAAEVGASGRNAALYWPRLVQPDPLRPGRQRTGSVVGAVAGVIARTDATTGVWKAPAGGGAMLSGVDSLSATVTDAEHGVLNLLGINCLRQFPDRAGPVLWGARTLSSDPEWKYLPVRRLLLHIEESLSRGTQWAVLEPSIEATWARVRSQCEDFLVDLWRRGAFPGSRPSEAFFVRCGRDTMTQADIVSGRLIALVGVAPLQPGEFIIARLQHSADGL
jgi:phage tail sheath protein FI